MRAAIASLLLVLGGGAAGSAPGASHVDLIAFDSNRSPWLTDHLYTAEPDGSHMHLLGIGTRPSVSPDGKRIAFRRAGHIWVMRRDGRGGRAVAASIGSSLDGPPMWSADQRRLAYSGRTTASAGDELDVLDLRSGRKIRLPAARAFSWSPDGRRLAYMAFDPFPGALVVVAADGSGSKVIRTEIEGGTGLAWSPDGRWLAYTRIGTRWQDLYRIRPDGSQETRLTRDLDEQSVLSWSPNGHWLAYLRLDSNDLGESVRLLDVRNLHIRPLRPGTQSTGDWSPNSRALLLRREGPMRIFNVKTHTLRHARTRPPADHVTGSSWIGPGRLLFSARLQRKDFDLYTIRPDGSALHRLTSDPADDSAPTWSPDGQRIAFVRGRDRTTLCTLVLGRRGRRCFGAETAIPQPTWSPSGERIAYRCLQTICLLDPANGRVRQLPDLQPPATGGLSWAPDGKRIVYAAAGSLFVIDTGTEAIARLTNAAQGADSQPAWSPDGRRIVFWSYRNATKDRDPKAYGLFEVDPTVGEPSVRKLKLPAYSRPAWAPDGRRLALEGGRIFVGDENASSLTAVTRKLVGSRDEFPGWRP
jgi:TolB protein